jgi:hypothetical protein
MARAKQAFEYNQLLWATQDASMGPWLNICCRLTHTDLESAAGCAGESSTNHRETFGSA